MASELDVIVVVPELTTNVKYPGVTTSVNNLGVQPNGQSSLITGVTIDGLSTAVTTPSLASAIQQEVPFTATVTGVVDSISTPGLFTRALDSVTISAPAYISIQKPFTETIQIADSVVVLLRFDRNILETLAINSGIPVFQINSAIENTAVTSDAIYKQFLVVAENQSTSLAELSYYQATKVFLDTLSNTSYTSLAITKPLTSSITISDSNNITTTTSYIRNLEELVDATDDYYGAATIGEDEYASFNKIVVDTTQNSEVISKYVANILQDFSVTNEQNYYQFTKLLSDSSTSLVEDNSYAVGKVASELASTTETSVLNIGLIKTDIVNTSELFNRTANYIRNYVDVAITVDAAAKYTSILKQDFITGISDVFSTFIYWMREFTTDFISSSEYARFTVKKALVETSSTLDTQNFYFNKITNEVINSNEAVSYQLNYVRSLEDLVDATDDYYGAATIGDDEYASFSKVIADGVLQTDTSVFSIEKILTDTSTSTDSAAYNVKKSLSEQITNAEFIPITVVAPKSDTINNSEAKYFNISAVLDNTVASSELFTSNTQYLRSFAESSTAQDLAALYNQLVKTDSINNSDTVTKSLQFYRELFETTQSSEYKVVLIGKTLIDILSISEVKSINLDKPLADSYSISELLTSTTGFIRSFQDQVDATDDYYGAATIGDDEYATFNKVVADAVAKADTAKFDIAKILEDTSYNTDTNKYTFTKPVTEVVSNAEVSQKSINKISIDNYSISELLTSNVNFIRSFQDSVDATDDYYGAATIGDDEYAAFNKVVSDAVARTDTTKFDIAKILQDISYNADTNRYTFTKPVTETVSIVETSQKYIAKPLTDNYYVSDLLSSNTGFTRSFQDSVDATDDYYGAATIGEDEYASFNKVVADAISRVDTTKFDIAKILQDISYNADTSRYTFTKPVTEAVANAEIFRKLANILELDTTGLYNRDNTQFTAQPNKIDSILSADVLTYLKSTGNLLTDLIHLTDSGTINNQNYFASSYVTPGYAGTNVTFGT